MDGGEEVMTMTLHRHTTIPPSPTLTQGRNHGAQDFGVVLWAARQGHILLIKWETAMQIDTDKISQDLGAQTAVFLTEGGLLVRRQVWVPHTQVQALVVLGGDRQIL